MTDSKPLDFQEYFDRVECYFALKRNRALLLSPEEFEVVEEFYREGVPLKVFFRGIDRFFERKRKRKRKSRRIFFLTHVRDTIEEVWNDYKKKGAGSFLVSGDSETEFIYKKIDTIIERLNECDASVKTVAERARAMLEELKREASELTIEDVEIRMEGILKFATGEIFDILNGELKEVAFDVERELNDIKASLGKDIAPDIVERFKRHLVFEKLNFPEVTLFD